MRHPLQRAAAIAVTCVLGQGVHAQGQQAASPATTGSGSSAVQITGSRFGQTVQEVPMALSIVTGEEIRARGATDLRTALSLLGGVTVAPGGDAGPAAAVPGLLGAREVDDLLLLIDGVPAGSVFIPQFEAVSLVNVERIEILRGAAPVYFGTTAFAGTINVIHYAAGQADRTLRLSYGSHGSLAASGAVVLSNTGFRQSLSLDLSRQRLRSDKTGSESAQGSWRGAGTLGDGSLRADIKLLWQHQKPTSPTPVDQSGQLTRLLPIDYNANPADSKLDTQRGQLVLGYDLPLAFGRWSSLVSYTQTRTDSVRGFLDLADTPLPWTSSTVADVEAFSQALRLRELFIDSHLTMQPWTGVDLTAGVNLLSGRARASSLRYAYQYNFDGTTPPPAVGTLAAKTVVTLPDDRRLIGLYAQSRIKLDADVSLLAGLRWNDTHETTSERRVTTRNGAVTVFDREPMNVRRASGSLGLDWKLLRQAGGAVSDLNAYASVGNTFQLPQIGFGPSPEARPEGTRLLSPETQKSLIYGLKGRGLDGLLDFDIDGFWIDFSKQPVQATVGTATVLRAQGKQRYKGLDVEGRLTVVSGFAVAANLGWADARYRDALTTIDGTPTQLAGKQLILTPRLSAGAGLIYSAERGFRGSLTVKHLGAHYLDEVNTVRAPAYQVVDMSLGWRFQDFGVNLSATNLGDKRPAVQGSELGEGTFYRLPGRRVFATVDVPF